MCVLNFPSGNIFCSRSIILAFLCLPWVNREGKREDICCLGHKIIKNQHIVKLWVNFPKIFFKLWKATNIKLNFLSERWLHHFVATLPLTVVPPYLPRVLALVNSTIRCENFFNEKCFTSLSGAHHVKWKFMSKHKFWMCFGFHGNIAS